MTYCKHGKRLDSACRLCGRDNVRAAEKSETGQEKRPRTVPNRYASVILTEIRSFCQLIWRLNRSFWRDVWFSDDTIDQSDRSVPK